MIVDHSWPLVSVRWPKEAIAPDALDRLFAATDGWLARREPFAMLTDGRDAAAPTALVRKRLAENAKQNEDALARYLAASAVVVGNPVVRAMITAVNWLAPPRYPVKVFTDVADAEAWARGALERAGRARASSYGP